MGLFGTSSAPVSVLTVLHDKVTGGGRLRSLAGLLVDVRRVVGEVSVVCREHGVGHVDRVWLSQSRE